jgi:hypothetical protein
VDDDELRAGGTKGGESGGELGAAVGGLDTAATELHDARAVERGLGVLERVHGFITWCWCNLR